MTSHSRRVGQVCRTAAALVLSAWPLSAHAQSPQDAARSESESGLVLSADVFCAEGKLRTASVRLHWTLAPGARAAAGAAALATATSSLDTTVYPGGFEKGLFVTLRLPRSTPARPILPVAAANAQARPPAAVRAYQIQLVQVDATRAAVAGPDGGEITAVVENLEPGMNYTWRLTIETGAGRLVSTPVTIQAPTCPADMLDEREPERAKPAPRPRRRQP